MTNSSNKETEKMANLGRMTRGILHDLNNSLASIMGFSSFLTDDLDPKSEHYIFAENIKKAATQIETLVEQIRALSMERGSNKDVTLNLVETIKEMIDSSNKEIVQQHQIIFMSDIKGAIFSVPLFQFKVMFSNLLKNSLQSLGDSSGTVMIHLSSTHGISPKELKGDYHFMSHPFDINLPHDKSMLKIDIIDTGCGLDEVTLNLAPSPHFTTKSADIAHGLGLTISSQIIHTYGGSFSISTTPNIGTRVTIVLPVEKIIL
jgi:signal transduction histidine kinase